MNNLAATDQVAAFLDDGTLEHAASAENKNSSVVITLPGNVQAGRYTVRLTVNGKAIPVPGELRVAGAPQAKPVITGISTPVYPPEEGKQYSFSILGDHFGNKNDTSVVINQRPIQSVATDCSKNTETPCINVTSSHVIEVFGFKPERYEGPATVMVRVGSLWSDEAKLTFSHYRVRSIRALAFLITALIALLVYYLVRRGVGHYRVGQQRFSAFSMFIIDKDTNSYSLSKLQLLLWTSTSVFAYIYFYLCRILIQWSSQLPDVPEGMPTLIGLSAGTTVAAAGLTTARGPKGAGPLSPTPADFISSGGVVVAERFQFFVWTIVGILSFIGLVFNSDPAHLRDLPKIPDNFLTLMGISSAGYLAGKAVRRAGPVISRVDTSGTASGAQLMLKVDGQNIEETAKIRIDKKEYNPKPEEKSRKAQEGGGKFYTHLEWTIPWEEAFNASTHLLEIVNDDGQVATADLTLKAMRITEVSEVPATKNEVELTAAASDEVGTFVGEWSPPGATDVTEIPAHKIEVSGGKVRIKLTPGETEGVARLALIDSSGQRALAAVKVIAVSVSPSSVQAKVSATVTISGTDLPTLTKARWNPRKGDAKDAAIAKSGDAYTVTFDAGEEKGEGTLDVSAASGFTASLKITLV